jgi:hypothetical protein
MPNNVDMQLLLEETFEEYGKEITGGSTKETPKLFISQFGTSPFICSILWMMINEKNGDNLMRGSCPKKLLWALLFLRTYAKESTRRKLCNADQKTLQKWVWYFVTLIADLAQDVVSGICSIGTFV